MNKLTLLNFLLNIVVGFCTAEAKTTKDLKGQVFRNTRGHIYCQLHDPHPYSPYQRCGTTHINFHVFTATGSIIGQKTVPCRGGCTVWGAGDNVASQLYISFNTGLEFQKFMTCSAKCEVEN